METSTNDYWIKGDPMHQGLQGKTVEFQMLSEGRVYRGSGVFRIRERQQEKNMQSEIAIVVTIKSNSSRNYTVPDPPKFIDARHREFYLSEDESAKIEAHPDSAVAAFRCFAELLS